MRAVALLTIAWFAAAAGAALPVGPSPAPVEVGHFPSRVHAFVFRNWNLVETIRLAEVLGCSREDVAAVAESMGLPAARRIPAEYRKRLYISLIKRNWHLLPYEQLLTLLGMSAEELGHTLREDDFLWIKLGMLKPKCERLTYAPPPETERRRAAEIKAHIEKHFPDFEDPPAEAPLAFLGQFNRSIPNAEVRRSRAGPRELRYVYSYFSVFGDPLLDASLDPYPDGLLQKYADLGVTGVWLHVVLRELAPPTEAFAEFGKGHEIRLANLAKLVARANRFGLRVYLYMNEPRAMPDDFFKQPRPRRAELRGTREGEHFALCTSHPVVREWLGSSLAHVFQAVPDLGGVFTITASENFTNCASHNNHKGCARCRDRKPAEILAELNTTIEQGVHGVAPRANVIAWDWGWPDAIAADVIKGLPDREGTWLQSVSEWSLRLERGGTRVSVGEYSISAVGPGPRATRHWGLAKARGLGTVAKIQANNTWELSAVPYLPAIDLVAEHAGKLAKADVDGLMLSWSLGGYPSPNLEALCRLVKRDAASKEEVLNDIARRTFGEPGAPQARKAWSLYAQAFQEFPYDGGVVYNAPLQVGPANLLHAKPTGYRATMVGLPYDDLERWRGPYPADVFIGQVEKVAQGFAAAEEELARAVSSADGTRELNVAKAARLHFASVAAQAKFVRDRDALAKKKMTREALAGAVAGLKELVAAEAEHAKALYSIQRNDSRIGFEASNHYYYFPQDLVEKHLNCGHIDNGLRTIDN